MTMLRLLLALGALTAVAANPVVNATINATPAAEPVEHVEEVEEPAIPMEVEALEEAKSEVDGFSEDARTQMEESAEKHQFQAETNRLMDIIINSLYTDKLVFLRELVSNAADALEKVRFHSVQDPEYLGETKDMEIKIEFDEAAKTLTLTDTGVGMTKAHLIENLGTVAKSGTSNFLEAMQGDSDSNLIGQFGVGFYSAFLVADKVTVTSKNNEDDKQHIWESVADASFSVAEDPRGNTLGRGSRVTLHLKEDALELLSESKLKELTGKFSQFVNFPIYVKSKKEVEEEADDDLDEDDDDDDAEDSEDADSAEKTKQPKTPVKKTVYEWDQVNTQKAIWLRSKDDVKEAEYQAFYKATSKDHQDAMAYTHFGAEGEVEFKSLLFLPKKLPFGFVDNYWNKESEVKLYVRRVLVAETVEDLLPRYLRFVRGVVDADDLPLNVSRENLQQNKVVKIIAKKLVRKVLDLIRKLARDDKEAAKDKEEKESEDAEKEVKKAEKKETKPKYPAFYEEYGKFMKIGCQEDDSNRSKLAKLLRFRSTKSLDSLMSLEDYVERAKDDQKSIYFMSGDSLDVMQKSPALQMFKQKDLEVLLLDDALDEPCLQRIGDFEGNKLVSIQKGDLKLPETEEEKKQFTRVTAFFEPLTTWMKKTLKAQIKSGDLKNSGIKVEKVEMSKRLVDAPVAVVSGQFGHSAMQEKVMRANAFGQQEQLQYMIGQKVLELNPRHPVVQDLLEKVKANAEDQQAKDTAAVLFQAALLEGGFEIQDPSALVRRVHIMMAKELGVAPDAPLVDVEIPEEEEEAEAEDAVHAETDDAEEVDASGQAGVEKEDAEAAEETTEATADAEEQTEPAASQAEEAADAPADELEMPAQHEAASHEEL